MIVNLRYMGQHPERVHKFQVTNIGTVVRKLPDMMKYRVYKYGKLKYESIKKELPMDNDLIEYDAVEEEWFIVKEETI